MINVVPLKKNNKAYENYVCGVCFHTLDKCTCRAFPPYEIMCIDREMQYIIRTLVSKGHLTNGCCEGHYEKGRNIVGRTYISFIVDGMENYGIPDGFVWKNKSLIHDYKNCSKQEMAVEKEKVFNTLINWVDNLPSRIRR